MAAKCAGSDDRDAHSELLSFLLRPVYHTVLLRRVYHTARRVA
jgi:hypothetical protein